jgi:tRNA (cytidine56-2'-O)-methyltransferase
VKVTVLRLGHRFERDRRVSTHLALTARAFGADRIIFDARDERVRESVFRISEGWGGGFDVEFVSSWRKAAAGFRGDVIHLTMYGLDLDEALLEIDKSRKDKLIIVGGKKVPSEVYKLATYNVSVGHQPHSEVAALAVFLDRLSQGKALSKKFAGAKKRIIPQERGKKFSCARRR